MCVPVTWRYVKVQFRGRSAWNSHEILPSSKILGNASADHTLRGDSVGGQVGKNWGEQWVQLTHV